MENLNEALVKAVSWTLIHSLWQGLILAVLAGLVIVFTKKASSAVRYNLLAGLFVLFVLVSGLTFTRLFQYNNQQSIIIKNLSTSKVEMQTSLEGLSTISSDPISSIIDFLNQNTTIIVLLWFVIFSIKCFTILSNFGYVYRIRNYKTQVVPEYWEDKFSQLCKLINLDKSVVLLESQLVQIPSMTGFLKPIILIPVGLLSSLPQDQVEAILLHELAHIKRKDYLINIIQNFIEIVFFFNPGVLWLSSILKDERENCCDDLAIAVTKSKKDFVQALVSFQEFNHKKQRLAMGFGGHKKHLLNRAKRIIFSKNKTLNVFEKSFLSVCFLVITSFVILNSNAQQKESNLLKAQQNDKALVINKLKSREHQDFAMQQALNNLAIELQKSRIEETKVRIEEGRAKIELDKARIELDKARIESDKAKGEAERGRIESIKAKIESDKARIEAGRAKGEAERGRIESIKAKIESDKARIEVAKSRSKSVSTIRTRYEKIVTSDKDSQGKSIATIVLGEQLPANFNDDLLTSSIIKDLLQNKVIKSKSKLSFKISNEEIIVNGVKQTGNLVKKLKQKYIKDKNMAICYNWNSQC
jgi:bla regulator protein BlaR1